MFDRMISASLPIVWDRSNVRIWTILPFPIADVVGEKSTRRGQWPRRRADAQRLNCVVARSGIGLNELSGPYSTKRRGENRTDHKVGNGRDGSCDRGDECR